MFPERRIQVVGWTLAAILSMLIILVIAASAHDARHPSYDEWYGKLQHPPDRNGFTSCCSLTDCHTTDAELRGGAWWARLGLPSRVHPGEWTLDAWVQVPPEAVLQRHDNPTGEAVICHGVNWAVGGKELDVKATEVWCFVPGVES